MEPKTIAVQKTEAERIAELETHVAKLEEKLEDLAGFVWWDYVYEPEQVIANASS